MNPRQRRIATIAGLLLGLNLGLQLPGHAAAQAPAGLEFSHQDWSLTCDNTRTCRAAGYHSDDDMDNGVSVLLTRNAGPAQAVSGKVSFNRSFDAGVPPSPGPSRVALVIDGRTRATVHATQADGPAPLPAEAVAALLAALTRSSRIEWIAGSQRWRLSDKGAAAVLLKMDEFQGRLGTTGALMRKGAKDEAGVLPPLPAPVITVPPEVAGDTAIALSAADKKALVAAIRAADDCPETAATGSDAQGLTAWRLASGRMLVSVPCWQAAYNSGDAFYVVNHPANHVRPLHLELVTSIGEGYAAGTISAQQKGRGLADCIGTEEWTWNGTRFIHSAVSMPGLCKGFLGDAWNLPLLVTEVRSGGKR